MTAIRHVYVVGPLNWKERRGSLTIAAKTDAEKVLKQGKNTCWDFTQKNEVSHFILQICRISRPEPFCKNSVLRISLRSATLLKMRFWHKCFPVNFAKFSGTISFPEQLRWLFLKYKQRTLFRTLRTWDRPRGPSEQRTLRSYLWTCQKYLIELCRENS